MYNISQNFKDKVYLDSTRHLLNIYIDGQKIRGKYILGFSRDFNLFEDKFEFGGTPSAQIELKIHKDGLPNTYQEIYVETGIDNETVPIGTYRLEEISKDDNYTVTIKAMDYMLKFEFNYDGSTLFSENKKSATLLEVLQDICNKAEVELGSTSFLNQDKMIAVYDNTVTARTYLSYIAEQAGGFAFIGRDNKLYIKTIASNVVEKIPFRLFQKYTWGEEFRVSRIAYEDGIQDFKAGNEIDFTNAEINNYTVRQVDELLVKYMYKNCNTVWINSDNMYIVDKEQIENIYNLYQLFSCWSFEGTTIINPALDLGDMIEIGGRKVIYQGRIEYKRKFKADISSKIQAKSKEDSMVTRVSTATKIRRVQSRIDQINGEIETLVEEIDGNNEKISQALQTVDGIKETVKQNTDNIENIKSNAVSEAIKGAKEQLGKDLDDYKIEVGTIIETKAGEIETSLTGKISTQMGDYVKTVDMEHHVSESISGYDRTIAQKYITKKDSEDTTNALSTRITSLKQTVDGFETDISSTVTNQINNKMGDYVKTTEMSQHVSETINSYNRTISENYITKTASKEVTDSLSSRIGMTTKSIKLGIDNGSTSSGITIEWTKENGQTDSVTGTITMSGVVEFNDLKNAGSTIINGANVTTGTISSEHLDTSTIKATSGTIGGIEIGNSGLLYSGSSWDDGFRLMKGDAVSGQTPARRLFKYYYDSWWK